MSIYLNWSSFTAAYNSDPTNCPLTFTVGDMASAIRRASDTWNVEAGATVTLAYAGIVVGTPPTGAAVVRSACDNSGRSMWTDDFCGTMGGTVVTVYLKGQNWYPGFATGGQNKMLGVLTHEFGHVLGLHHQGECYTKNAPPYCQSSTSFCSDTVMEYTYTDDTRGVLKPNQGRHLWEMDISGLRNGGVWGCSTKPCTSPALGYGQRTSGYVRHQRQVLPGTGWVSEPDALLNTTNGTPAVALGLTDLMLSWCSATPCQTYMVAFNATNGSNSLMTYLTNGLSGGNQVYTGGYSRLAPALAYGNGVWVLVHVAADDSRRMYWQTSTNGYTWSSPAAISYGGGTFPETHSTPALTYNLTNSRFGLVWPDRRTSQLNTLSLDATNPTAWTNIWTVPAYLALATNGLGAGCNAVNQCVVSYTHENGSVLFNTGGYHSTSGTFQLGLGGPTYPTYASIGEASLWTAGVTYIPTTAFELVRVDWSTSRVGDSRRRSTWDPTAAWGSVATGASGNKAGLSVTYGGSVWNEVAAYGVRP